MTTSIVDIILRTRILVMKVWMNYEVLLCSRKKKVRTFSTLNEKNIFFMKKTSWYYMLENWRQIKLDLKWPTQRRFSSLILKVQKQSPGGVLWKSVFKNFAKFTGKHLCQSLFLKSTLKVCFIKKEAPAEVLFCEFHKVFKKAFLVEHLWLLLKVYLNENFAGLHS